ncbi:MAG: hypothetical protein ABSE95_16290 [Thermodesulfobacteriota bacterium]|jgi:hypothetical protein
MFVQFTLCQMLNKIFGVEVDLPIAGGFGNSIDEPVFIESKTGGNYRQVEGDYLNYICMCRHMKWELVQHDLISVGERRIEKVKIKTQDTTSKKIITKVEDYYFDITDCVVPAAQQKKTYRDFPELLNELDARDVVFRRDFNSKERRSKAPWSASFGKGELQTEDDTLWQQLFYGRISEETALDAMTDLMERYYGRKYPLSRQLNRG